MEHEVFAELLHPCNVTPSGSSEDDGRKQKHDNMSYPSLNFTECLSHRVRQGKQVLI